MTRPVSTLRTSSRPCSRHYATTAPGSKRRGPDPLVVSLRQRAFLRSAVAFAQAALVAVERLLDAVDEHALRGRAEFERVAVPQYDVAMRARPQHAERAAEPGDLRRDRADRRESLAPGQPARAGQAVERDEVARLLRRGARLVVAGEPADRDLDPGVDHPPDVRLGRAE